MTPEGIREFLREAEEKERERKVMTYEDFLEQVESIQLPRWQMVKNKIRADDESQRSPIQVLAGFSSRQTPATPAECASALHLEFGSDLALIIMKAEDNEWLEEDLVKRIRKDILEATGLSEQ
jgi:hypothetical protein